MLPIACSVKYERHTPVNTGRKTQHAIRLWTAAALLLTAIAASAANTGDEVVVIYNSRLPESKTIANYYAEKRQVPKQQIFGFDMTAGEDISRAEFRDALQKPLAKKLEADKLWRFGSLEIPATNDKPARVVNRVVTSKIRYLVLCYGIPLKILPDPTLKEAAEESMRPELRRNGASVDSELACLPLLNLNLPVAGPLPNPVYSVTNAAWIHPTNSVLIVARLDGPTPEIARALVDKALEAEHDGLWGRAYFDLRNITDPNYKQGDDWIRAASEAARIFGFETVVDTNGGTFPASFPLSQIGFYAGWYSEGLSGAFTLPKLEFMPGAFAYHLHSFSAASMRNTNNNWVAPLLARGVTATMGSVDEPYLAGTPDVGVFTSRFLFFGMSFGEAACAAQGTISWQTTVVGDPLYRPFQKPPPQLHQELEARHSKLLEWSHLRVVNLTLARSHQTATAVGYLEEAALTKQSAVLSEKLGDLYAAQGKPSSTVRAYEQALKLDPSPQQRIRLRLALGDKLIAQDRNEDAFANYQKFLEEAPNYAENLTIYRKLLPLSQKLGKSADVAKYEEHIRKLTEPAKP